MKKINNGRSNKQLRIIGFVIGNIYRDAHARVKYGCLYRALGEKFSLLTMKDATLSGIPRYLNALRYFHPNLHKWRERFYMNVGAFKGRSKKVAAILNNMEGKVDLIFQDGSMFDSQWKYPSIPMVVYIDYTVRLALRHPETSRFAFKGRELDEWLGLESRVYQRSAHIFTDSRMARNSIVEDYGIPKEKVTVVGRGVNFESMPEVSLKEHQKDYTFLFIGKDFYRKGGDLLLESFKEVHKQYPQTKLILITKKPDSQPSDLPGVEWVAPTWERSEIKNYYRQADLFVLPSRMETWGDVLLEAMAHGLPCIGVDCDAMPEIIQDGKTGWIIPGEDVKALTGCMLHAINHPEISIKLGRAGRQRVEKYFTWEKVVDRMAEQIEKVIIEREEK